MMMTDPYREDFDEGDKCQWKVLSNGPYKVEGGVWDKNNGATLVRNENYDAATDDPEQLRLALPDRSTTRSTRQTRPVCCSTTG